MFTVITRNTLSKHTKRIPSQTSILFKSVAHPDIMKWGHQLAHWGYSSDFKFLYQATFMTNQEVSGLTLDQLL